ncbi:hypothetical protein V6N12_058049 [Hibiscus sabdariffa]|uniref:Uncharacterized protein n=1 Tax=Hibiscus sabdariffa TaxID=183260 RepID=A0ABR2BCU7_9ROSI
MARFQARSAYWKKSGRYQQSRLEAWSFMNDRKLAANIQGEGLEGFSNLRMAGDVVLLVFESSDALNRVKKDKCDALEKWFYNFETWTEESMVESRH